MTRGHLSKFRKRTGRLRRTAPPKQTASVERPPTPPVASPAASEPRERPGQRWPEYWTPPEASPAASEPAQQDSVPQAHSSGVWLMQLWGRYYYVRRGGTRWETRGYDQPLAIPWCTVDALVADEIEKSRSSWKQMPPGKFNWDAITKTMRRSNPEPESATFPDESDFTSARVSGVAKRERSNGGNSILSVIRAFVRGFQGGISGSGTGARSVRRKVAPAGGDERGNGVTPTLAISKLFL